MTQDHNVLTTVYHDSTSYVRSKPKAFYPLEIPPLHHQLKHFISTARKDVIYYTSKHNICALHMPTKRRVRLATLQFIPQCLGYSFGWLCVGGCLGRAAFLDVSGTDHFGTEDAEDAHGSEVDSLLPLNLDPNPRDPSSSTEDVPGSSATRQRSMNRAKIYTREIGRDMINSMTLFRLYGTPGETRDEDIALISTNEKYVHIFSLTQLRTLQVIKYPKPMNHASISPDGELLVACGDDLYAYFHRRRVVDVSENSGTFLRYDWEEIGRIALSGTLAGDTCFSTAFSPSGHICAVSSQYGIVNIFDTSRVKRGMTDPEESVMCYFSSSRPSVVPENMHVPMPGAIRSSCFSPAPWDLFVWAEDRARVCIVDLRDGFHSRQLLELSMEMAEPARMTVTDMEEASSRERNPATEAGASHLDWGEFRQPSNSEIIQRAADQVEENVERRIRDVDFSSLEPLTAAQRSLVRHGMESLGVNADGQPQDPAALLGRSRDPRSFSSSTLRSSNGESLFSSPRAYPPRRRSSVVISNSNAGHSSSSTPHPSSLAPITGSNNLSTSPSRLGESSNNASSTDLPIPSSSSNSTAQNNRGSTSTSAWETISAAINSATATDAPESSSGAPSSSTRDNPSSSLGRYRYVEDYYPITPNETPDSVRLRSARLFSRLRAEAELGSDTSNSDNSLRHRAERERARQRLELREFEQRGLQEALSRRRDEDSDAISRSFQNLNTQISNLLELEAAVLQDSQSDSQENFNEAFANTHTRGGNGETRPGESPSSELTRMMDAIARSRAARAAEVAESSSASRPTGSTSTSSANGRGATGSTDPSSSSTSRDDFPHFISTSASGWSAPARERFRDALRQHERQHERIDLQRFSQLRRLQERARGTAAAAAAAAAAGGSGSGSGTTTTTTTTTTPATNSAGAVSGAGLGNGMDGEPPVFVSNEEAVAARSGGAPPSTVIAIAAAGIGFHGASGFSNVDNEWRDLRNMGGDTGSEFGLAIMGMGWSADGRSLYIGTEHGVFEFELATGMRKQFPAITPR